MAPLTVPIVTRRAWWYRPALFAAHVAVWFGVPAALLIPPLAKGIRVSVE